MSLQAEKYGYRPLPRTIEKSTYLAQYELLPGFDLWRHIIDDFL